MVALFVAGGTIVDGTGAPPRPNPGVLIEEGKISRLGGNAPRGAEVLDASGCTVLPGLIDCHEHLLYSSALEPESWHLPGLRHVDRDSPELTTIKATRNAARLLAAGYTTVRDVGSIGGIAVAVRDAAAAGLIAGPRILAAGPIICTTAGQLDIYPPWIQRTGPSQATFADGPEAMVRAVRTQVKMRVDLIKAEASGLEINPYTRSWTTTASGAELSALVAEAHNHGLPVAIHAQSSDGIKNALRAGADTIEHGTYLDEEGIALFKETGAVLVPTLQTLFGTLERGPEMGVAARVLAEMETNREPWIASVRMAHEAGIPIAAGSDIGARYAHGENAIELEFLMRVGLTPLEAISASTGVAARALQRPDIGVLVAGKVGDVLILQADPLTDMTAMRSAPRTVVQAGVVVHRIA